MKGCFNLRLRYRNIFNKYDQWYCFGQNSYNNDSFYVKVKPGFSTSSLLIKCNCSRIEKRKTLDVDKTKSLESILKFSLHDKIYPKCAFNVRSDKLLSTAVSYWRAFNFTYVFSLHPSVFCWEFHYLYFSNKENNFVLILVLIKFSNF